MSVLSQAVMSAGLPRDLEQTLLYFSAMAQSGIDETGTAGTFFFGGDLISRAASFFSVSTDEIERRKSQFDSGAAKSPLRIVPATARRYGGGLEACWKISLP